ncbi:MAG: hypothetical protein OEV66_12615 [Spirochaetia bacterium]|nr:hypothetical protein [Spirochaetia bacterium]
MVFHLLHKFIVIFSLILIGGCQSTKQIIESKSHSTKNNIFVEINQENKIEPGFTMLNINLSFKTPEGRETANLSKSDYSVVLNIDGQSVIWPLQGIASNETNSGTENGKAVKYNLSKNILLKNGRHKFFVALPEIDYQKEFDMDLTDPHGHGQTLNLVPQYNHKQCKRDVTYLAGIRDFDVYLDEKVIFKKNHIHYQRPGRHSPC